jgi:FKBP-type peptidyl-prolyl cis-trans isomerase FkpA
MEKKLIGILTAVVLAACGGNQEKNDGFKKAESGFMYKIVGAAAPGDSIRYRDIAKVQLSQYIDDSLLNSTIGKMPEYVAINNELKPFNYTDILLSMRVNDSAVCLFPTKEVIRRAGENVKLPAFLNRGQYIKVYFKVLASFGEDALAMADMEKTQNGLVGYTNEDEATGFARAAKSFDSLIGSLPQKPVKLPVGVYVQVAQKGMGEKVKTGQEVAIVFKGRLPNGTIFDEATAQSPMRIHVGTGETFEGFDKAIASLSLGDKATLYIPAPLAYGAKKAGEYIPAFSNLIFDVKILDQPNKGK